MEFRGASGIKFNKRSMAGQRQPNVAENLGFVGGVSIASNENKISDGYWKRAS